MPPILFSALSYPFTRLAYLLFPVAVANGVISGAFGFCKLFPVCLSRNVHSD
jgi:4-hydroxysphinganine ceramide fatty acyl 2-hydroxylase